MTGYESKKAAAQDKMVVIDLDGHVVRDVRNTKKAATQRPWAGLTNEIIENIFQSAADADDETHIRFARAIEQHLKSKNT